jgi:toxin-antitoxin system PIN domain toxin
VVALDANLLVYAFRRDLPAHEPARKLIEEQRKQPAAWAVPAEVVAAFLRLVTNPRVFRSPTPLDEALAFIAALRASPSLLILRPGPRHFDLFLELCERNDARGKLVPDAWLAALAIEHGCTWWSTDRDFLRFEGLAWRNPLAGP